MKYCPKCGSEVRNNTKFCQKCGAKFPETNKYPTVGYCSYCGSNTPPGVVKCPKCGKYLDEEANDDHSVAIIIGYIFSFLVPLAAIVAGFYLVTQKNENVHKHGVIIFIISIVVIFISYLYFANIL